MGTNGLWGSLGEAAGPMLVAQVAALASWRAAYIALAPLMVILGICFAARRLEVPRSQARLIPPRITPLLAALLLAMTFAGFNYWIVRTSLPEHIQASTSGLFPGGAGAGARAVRGGYLAGLIYLVGGLGQYLAGHAIHHREGRGLYILVFAIQAPLAWLLGRLTDLPLILTACAMSVFLFAAQPMENVLLARFSPARGRGTLFGLKFTLAFGIGGVGPWLSGQILLSAGTRGVFNAAAYFIAAAFVCAVAAYLRRAPAPDGTEGAPRS
jgi:hypothetical protein